MRDFREIEVFPGWIAAERHGEMKYMEARDDAGDLKRASLARVAPWARSVIVCALNYNTANPYSTQTPDSSRGWVSRYAWSREDYHDAVLQRLRKVEAMLRESLRAEGVPSGAEAHNGEDGLTAAVNRSATQNQQRPVSGTAEDVPFPESLSAAKTMSFPEDAPLPKQTPSVGLIRHQPLSTIHFRSYVDTGPLIERVYAKYAGIGWLAKNTCVINQELGSWLFLGVILTSLELKPGLPAPDRCGSCTRCIDACPTHAFVAPGELDARLCISYLTIEKRGEIPEELRAGIGRHVFGCDICQDVCPWNRKAPVSAAPEFQPRDGLVNPALVWLAEMQQEEFSRVFRKSPIRRAKLTGLRRNAVVAMGNSGNVNFLPALRKLVGDFDPVVSKHAQWALAKLIRIEAKS